MEAGTFKILSEDRLQRNWKWLLWGVSALSFFFIVFVVSLLLSRTYAVSLQIESDHEDRIRVYFDHSIFSSGFHESRAVSATIPPGEKKDLAVRVGNIPTTRLRIDPGEQAGVVKIYQISITQELGRKTVWSAEDIYSGFHGVNGSVDMSLENGAVILSFSGDDPLIVSNDKLLSAPFPPLLFIPVSILLFFFHKYISGYSPDFILSFFFPQRKQPSTKTSVILPLDGLRGFAILLVVAEHTLHPFLGAGRSGVLIFFSLSGFLLVTPYINSPEKFFSREHISLYLGRRLERILPLYITYLFIVYGLTFRFGEFLLHLLFIKGLGHLWALPQEMLFYLSFPVILCINCFLLRNNIFLIVVFLFSIILGWHHFVPLHTVYLYGMDPLHLPFMLPAFLSGSVFSYIYHKVLVNITPSRKVQISLSVVAVTIIFIFLFFSNAQLLHSSEIYAFTYSVPFGICAALLITILIFIRKSFLARIFSHLFLTSTGVVSYGLYLFHPLVINLVNRFHVTGGVRFFTTFLVSYCIACFTYHLIEVPCSTKRSESGAIHHAG